MLCKCELEAKRIQVKKEGPNKDRWFFACPQERAKQCDFFEWETREPVHKAPVTQEQHQEVMGALRQIFAEIKKLVKEKENQKAVDMDFNLADLPFNNENN